MMFNKSIILPHLIVPHLILLSSLIKYGTLSVVYLDQHMHACACVRMIENDKKHLKLIKKVPFASCAPEAHVRRMKKNEEL